MHIPTPEELKGKRESLGIRQSMVARIEAGNVDPRVSTLNKIVQVLNASVRPKVTAECVMNKPVLSVKPSDSISHAVEMMDKENISQIPVIEDGFPVGCVSETAIVNALDQPAQPTPWSGITWSPAFRRYRLIPISRPWSASSRTITRCS